MGAVYPELFLQTLIDYRRPGSCQLYTNHHSNAANMVDNAVLGFQLPQFLLGIVAEFDGAFKEIFLLDGLDDSDCCCAGERVSAEG